MAKQLTVIGGGAAGFFCAVNAARMNPGLKVVIVEKTNKLLSKIKVSGGGRCNVTHACFDIAAMSKKYPRGRNFVKKTFHQLFTADIVQWFEERGVKLKREADGRMFPVTDSSQTIIDCLMREADKYRVEIRMRSEVRRVKPVRTGAEEGKFRLELSDLRYLISDFICIACGGYPKSSMFDWVKELGHTIEEPAPSLFTFNMPGNPIVSLMGISVEKANVKVAGTTLEEQGPVLITHWGLSGPAILRLSAWGARELKALNYEFTVQVNWIPDFTEQSSGARLRQLRFELGPQKVSNRNSFDLPNRLWEFLLHQSAITSEMRWADLPAVNQNKLVKNLCSFEAKVKGKTTFKEEFVTAGGIKLNEVDPHTMMSKIIPKLFFAGEILDVDGITGGFNFQHAWTSGFIVAKSLKEMKK